MFEEYLNDACQFVTDARLATAEGDDVRAKRCYRAAVIVGNAVIETYVNFLAATFESAPTTLQPFELALMLERRFTLINGEFKMLDQPAFSRLEDRIRFLTTRFLIPLDYAAAPWSNFLNFKRLRDGLVHSKDEQDERSTADYDKACTQGLSAIVTIADVVSAGISGKGLRAKLHDLVNAL